MSRSARIAAAFVAALLVVPAALAPPAVAVKPKKFVDLKKVPKPKITGAEIIEGLEQFVADYPMRQSLIGPHNASAAEFLAREAKRNGFKSRVIEYTMGTPPRPIRVVEAIKQGTTKPEEWIAFVSHYDTVPGIGGATIQGAYDDGSGTNMMRFFGKAFKKIDFNRSIALLWFDAEEEGLLASQRYAEDIAAEGQEIIATFGFDMVGIGYPAPYCICIYHGPAPQDAAEALPVIDYVNFKFLKFPQGDGNPAASQKWPVGGPPHVCSCGPNIRNSDESNFAEQGYLTLRWTGMRTASDYPGYHFPWDTVQLMEQVAGGRANLEEGTENTFKSAYYTTFVFDNL